MSDVENHLTWKGTPEQVQRGCSLGNADCFLRADAQANIDGLWLAANNRWYCGELSLRVVSLGEMEACNVEFAAESQAVTYKTAESDARCRKWLHLAEPEDHHFAETGTRVYINLVGRGFTPGATVEIECRWRVGAALSGMHRSQPHPQDCERRWQPDARKRFTAVPCDEGKEGFALWASCEAVETVWTEPYCFRLRYRVLVSKIGLFTFWVCLEAHADTSAWKNNGSLDVHSGAAQSRSQPLSDMTFPQEVDTASSALIRKAVAWGKVGSRRVWHRYANGDWGFTNDPPGNTIVTRDAAWFIFGADHFAPGWSRALLETIVKHAVYPEGKIAEYVRLSPAGVERDDYNLNINDATPLFILAVEHHWQMTQNADALAAFYPAVKGAAKWILAQRRSEGLVWCDGRGTNVHGIGGWRNIIPGYRLAGALTELNAECVAALRGAARLAGAMGDKSGVAQYTKAARQLNDAMALLVDPTTGLFVLTRDENGPNPQPAIDLVFPALFEAGPEEARIRTLLRLLEPDFQHPHGLRCLSKDDPAYHPRFAWGLMGGSWPNATAWAAAALAPHQPEHAWELAEKIARALFPETWAAPNGVSVPGQFPEWFDGDTGESSGMSLSPWMPATYVWLVQEKLKA